MKISEALKKIKLYRNELSRKLSIRKDNFVVVIPKDTDLVNATNIIRFKDINKDILDIVENITILRERILKTNIKTIVSVKTKELSLAMLKLRIDNIRSELAQIQTLSNRLFGYDRRRIMKTEEEEKEVPQLTDLEIEDIIKEYETQKVELENLLEYTNATTELVE